MSSSTGWLVDGTGFVEVSAVFSGRFSHGSLQCLLSGFRISCNETWHIGSFFFTFRLSFSLLFPFSCVLAIVSTGGVCKWRRCGCVTWHGSPFNRPRLKVTPLHFFYRCINYRMNALGCSYDALTILEVLVFELFSYPHFQFL